MSLGGYRRLVWGLDACGMMQMHGSTNVRRMIGVWVSVSSVEENSLSYIYGSQ